MGFVATKQKDGSLVHTIRKYVPLNQFKDKYDPRDYKYSALKEAVIAGDVHDLSPRFPPAYDQSSLGSCTGNAIAGDLQYEMRRQRIRDFIPSRLFIYYNERAMEGDVSQDSGASISDGIHSVAKLGFCNEARWPYVIAKFANRPYKSCYEKALGHRSIAYYRLNMATIDETETCIGTACSFVLGISVYESFESDAASRTGMIPMPGSKEKLLGGHAIVIVGVDRKRKLVKFRNSWSPSWGLNGYGFLPYAYVTNPQLASDAWTIRKVA